MLATAMNNPPTPAVIDFSAVFKEAYVSHKTFHMELPSLLTWPGNQIPEA
jgi:hypothetical protein